jgi:hypothetical protein
MRTIHGAYPAGQRFALLKIAPGNFFISKEGWYSEAGISKRQQFGVSPDEHHSLCEWKMQVRGTQYVVSRVFRDAHHPWRLPYPQLFVMVYLQSQM